jgi:hypothetical protein
MRGPGGPVLDTKGATAGADRNGRSEVGPVECNADISTMTASVNPSRADWVVHVAWPWLISANVLANVEDHTTNAERGIACLDPTDVWPLLCSSLTVGLFRLRPASGRLRPMSPELRMPLLPHSSRCQTPARGFCQLFRAFHQIKPAKAASQTTAANCRDGKLPSNSDHEPSAALSRH